MSEKEIKDLAREYGVLLAKDIPLSNCLKNEVINSTEDYIVEFINWLSNRYCLVEKEIIRKEYERAKSTHDLYTSATCINDMESRAIDHSQGSMYELTTLFGKELFSDTEQ